jgi:hypothetical protein
VVVSLFDRFLRARLVKRGSFEHARWDAARCVSYNKTVTL